MSTYWSIAVIPDPTGPQLRDAANGDVHDAVWRASQDISAVLASSKPGGCAIRQRLLYTPCGIGLGRQERAQLELAFINPAQGEDRGLVTLIEHGPLSVFYPLQRDDPAEPDWSHFKAACQISRGFDLILPVHSRECNPDSPACYLQLPVLRANENNDWMLLDRVLDRVDSDVLVEMVFAPLDVSRLRRIHADYLHRLECINRGSGRHFRSSVIWADSPNDSADRPLREGSGPEPLRYKDPVADEVLRRQREYHESFRRPQLCFRIAVFAASAEAARSVGEVVTHSVCHNGQCRTDVYRQGEEGFDLLLHAAHEDEVPTAESASRSCQPLLAPGYTALAPLLAIGSIDEMAGAFRLPVANYSTPYCLRENTAPPPEKQQGLVVVGHDREHVGAMGGEEVLGGPLGIPFLDMVLHFVALGVPGSGKTLALINLLIEIYAQVCQRVKDRRESAASDAATNIGIIVIEPVNPQFRVLKTLKDHGDEHVRALAHHLRVFTPGKPSVSPCYLNVLEFLDGMALDQHIAGILELIRATIALFASAPGLLAEALENLFRNIFSDPDKPPTLFDLLPVLDKTLDHKSYSGDTYADFRGAFSSRLGILRHLPLGQVLQCPRSVPSIADLMSGVTLFELDGLIEDEGCLFTMALLQRIRDYVRLNFQPNSGLHCVIIIEEAHRLMSPDIDAKASEHFATPKVYASRAIARMLAELRAMGVALVLADQHAGELPEHVLKSTDAKLILRTTAPNDCDQIAAVAGLTPTQKEEFSRLGPGQGFFYRRGYTHARRIYTPNLKERLSIEASPSDAELRAILNEEAWYRQAMLDGEKEKLLGIYQRADRVDRQRANVFSELARLRASSLQSIGKEEDGTYAKAIHMQVVALGKAFRQIATAFLDGPYRFFSQRSPRPVDLGPSLTKLKEALAHRLESETCPGIRLCIAEIERLANELKSDEWR